MPPRNTRKFRFEVDDVNGRANKDKKIRKRVKKAALGDHRVKPNNVLKLTKVCLQVKWVKSLRS